ncbi:MAG TPA: DUF222 domain-containing protein, partial [Actinotalea sp.]|nr:DUF222 domain-containing protein [Actinotalea sp.]
LDRGLAGAGQQLRPHLSVHVSFESLRRQVRRAAETDGDDAVQWLPDGWQAWAGDSEAAAPAELDDGTPIPGSVLARLACDCEVSRIVFGPDGDVLDVGRTQRTFTGQQRRGVIARDRSCRFPGCHAPPNLGEVHHVAWWVRDHGPTAVDNGVLLCWYHHDLVHRQGLGITRDHGRWQFTRRDGSPVGEGRGSPGQAAPPGAARPEQEQLPLTA